MQSLPFTLKVPGKDAITVSSVSTTEFEFHGLLHLDDDALVLEWAGTAKVEEVSLLAMNQETVALPEEALTLPLDRVRTIALRGGWWRPRLELMGNDLEALRIVPSEDRGQVRLWLARRDRRLAAELVAQVQARR
jgi:hypothetical protein